MDDQHRRRDLLGEATGPTEDEFAQSGATFLIGAVAPIAYRHGLPVTPWDSQLNNFAPGSVDAIPQLVGALGDILRPRERSAEELADLEEKKRMRQATKTRHAAARASGAATALLRWFVSEEGDPLGSWTAPGKGAGFLFEGDDFVTRQVADKARAIAKDPRHRVHMTLVPTQYPEQYLVAFVADPRLVPLTYEALVNLAEVATEHPGEATVDTTDPSEVKIMTTPEQFAEANAAGIDAVGNVFKKLFGPKKPEGIKKRIEKLEKELEGLREQLKEAEAKAEGFYGVGYVPRYANRQLQNASLLMMLNAMGNTPGSASYYGPAIVDRLEGMGVGNLSDNDLEYGLAEGNLLGALDDDLEYGLVRGDLLGNLADNDLEYGLANGNLLGAVVGAYEDAYEAGEISQAECAALIEGAEAMDVGELADEAAGLGIVESGAFSFSPISLASSSSSSSGGKKGKRRRKIRRIRRKARKSSRSSSRRSSGGGGGSAQQPQIIVIQQKPQDDEPEEEIIEEVDGLVQVGSLLPRWNPEGTLVDVPAWNAYGEVVTYPVGGLSAVGQFEDE